MSQSARYFSSRFLIRAYWYYLMGEVKLADHLVFQSLTYTYPIGNLIVETYQ